MIMFEIQMKIWCNKWSIAKSYCWYIGYWNPIDSLILTCFRPAAFVLQNFGQALSSKEHQSFWRPLFVCLFCLYVFLFTCLFRFLFMRLLTEKLKDTGAGEWRDMEEVNGKIPTRTATEYIFENISKAFFMLKI